MTTLRVVSLPDDRLNAPKGCPATQSNGYEKGQMTRIQASESPTVSPLGS
ncbi:hypothetical protein [Spirosoma pollinicola]|nr:hypothetical protein [Spirosoma pollinicola]